MIKRRKQVITKRFSLENHFAVDLRCVNFLNWGTQKCIAFEDMEVVRNSNQEGLDGKGNPYIVYHGLKSKLLFKSIHIEPISKLRNGMKFKKGDIIGIPVIGGNSRELHEHFEIWKDESTPINPVKIFIADKINFRYKKGV